MIDIQITRLIAAAVAAVLLGWACYVTAYVKHKNEIRDGINKRSLAAKSYDDEVKLSLGEEVMIEKTETWYNGYRLALLGLIVTAAAVGWVAAWAVGQDHVLSWVEDAFVAFAGAVIGGFCLDKYIIHPIADGSFFEKVEDPIVQRFLQDGLPPVEDKVKEKKPGFFTRRKAKKAAKEETEHQDEVAAAEVLAEDKNPFDSWSFDEKVKLIEKLRKSL